MVVEPLRNKVSVPTPDRRNIIFWGGATRNKKTSGIYILFPFLPFFFFSRFREEGEKTGARKNKKMH